jgi:hypothetical protein
MSEAMWVFPGTAKIDVILRGGIHRYWSTMCRSERHGECRLTCKCHDTPCLCSCHNNSSEGGAGGAVNVD